MFILKLIFQLILKIIIKKYYFKLNKTKWKIQLQIYRN